MENDLRSFGVKPHGFESRSSHFIFFVVCMSLFIACLYTLYALCIKQEEGPPARASPPPKKCQT